MQKHKIKDFLLENRIKLATVSGIFTTNPAMIEWADKNIPAVELITSKSYQVKQNKGNREPIIVETGVGCFGNAVGLKNPGMEKGYNDLLALRKRYNLRSLLNVSLSANSIDDFIKLIGKFEDIADILELNFSCPHAKAGYGLSIGNDASIVFEYMDKIRKSTDALIFTKLTPNVSNIGEIALAAIEAGADGLSLINTYEPERYTEPHTGKPILYNPIGNKGGKSGEWIREIALNKVKETRDAVGSEVPIIGMGGMTRGEDVRRMIDAGANIVGIGSSLARVAVQSRPDYFSALKSDAENGTGNAEAFLSKKRVAEYHPYKITRITEKGDDLRIFELKGRIDYKPSQFVFIWAPEAGEKPFSVAKSDPLTFVIRKREYNPEMKKGLVTHALFQLGEDDELMIRGVYGADAPYTDKKNVYVIAGGTGIAVVPRLVQELHMQGKNVNVFYGIADKNQIVLEDEIKGYARFHAIADNGVVGRVLEVMRDSLKQEDMSDYSFYNIGPGKLMEKAMQIQQQMGGHKDSIFASIETNNMCGIGMCSECVCGNKLTCQEGTFFNLDYLESNGIVGIEKEK